MRVSWSNKPGRRAVYAFHALCAVTDPIHVSKKSIIAIGAVVVVIVAIGLPSFIRALNTTASNACVNNLRQINGAKQSWALENRKITNDIVTWGDIHPYLKPTLVCPQGGTYTLGRVGELPRCSVGGTGPSIRE